MRKLIGYVWLEAMGDTQFRSFQTGFLRKTDASHGVFVLERASEIAKEWKTPLFLAQLDLKKAFDHIQHSFASTALQHKRVSEQLLSVLNKWWTQSDVAVSLAITGHKRISFQRGLPQGGPESSAMWLFLIMSWGTWMLGGETETSIGQWTTSTSRALLTLTTCVFWRQA